MSDLRCLFCRSKDLKVENGYFLICLKCGRLQHFFNEVVDNEYDENNSLNITGRKIKIIKSMEDQFRVQKILEDSNDSPEKLDMIASQLVLEGFQKTLQAQICAVTQHFGSATGPARETCWSKVFRVAVGNFWMGLLAKWREKGWGTKKPMSIVFYSKRFVFYNLTKDVYGALKKATIREEFVEKPFLVRKKGEFGGKTLPKEKRKEKKDAPRVDKKSTIPLVEGELCIEMSLSLIILGLRFVNFPFLVTEIVHLANSGRIPYFNIRNCLPAELWRRMNEFRLNNTQLLSSFFVNRQPIKTGKLINLADKLVTFVNLPKALIRPDFFFPEQSILLRYSRKLRLPDKVFEAAVSILPFTKRAIELCSVNKSWVGSLSKDTLPTTKPSLIMDFTPILQGMNCFVALIVAAKLLLRLDDSGEHTQAFLESLRRVGMPEGHFEAPEEFNNVAELVTSTRSAMDDLPQPNGSEDYRLKLFAAVADELEKKGPRQEGSPYADMAAFLSKRSQSSFATGGFANNYIRYTSNVWFHETYLGFVSACARLSRLPFAEIHKAVQIFENTMKEMNRCLWSELNNGTAGKEDEKKKIHHKKGKFVEFCGNAGPLRYFSKFTGKRGEIYYRCQCGENLAQVNFNRASMHISRVKCQIEED